MSGDLSRTLAVLGLTAVVTAAGAPGIGRSEQAAPTGHAAPAWTFDPNAPISPGDIAARMRDENVPADVAERRFRVDDAVSAAQPDVAARWPATFGGIWVDTATFEVRVAFTAGAAANVAALAATFPYPEVLRSVTVERSYRDLLAVQDALRDDRAALTAAYGAFDLDVDLPGNQVVLRLAAVTDESRGRLQAAYGTVLRVETGLSRPDACVPSACHPWMYGGLHIDHDVQGCTGGFTASIGSYRYVLSAGHCYQQTSVAEVRHDGAYYGNVTAWRVSGRVDAERVRRLDATFRESSKFYVHGETPRGLTAYRTYANTAVGTYVGKTGRTTATTRGYIKSVNYAPAFVPNSSSFVTADYCAGGGDSGGPVWSSTTAFGLHSGSVPGTCRGLPNTGFYGVFGAIEFAIGSMAVTLLTGVNAPPVAEFTASCGMALMQCAFDGTSSHDPDGSITWSWDFGDGSSGTGAAPTHTYAAPGVYLVTLTVTDNDGTTAYAARTVDTGIGG